jgi:hypothetical protein
MARCLASGSVLTNTKKKIMKKKSLVFCLSIALNFIGVSFVSAADSISAPIQHVTIQTVKQVEGCVLKKADQLDNFSVVVGSFVNTESAKTLIQKLKDLKLTPYFVQNEKGMYRLITGTFKNRDDADYQVLKLDIESIKAWVLIK